MATALTEKSRNSLGQRSSMHTSDEFKYVYNKQELALIIAWATLWHIAFIRKHLLQISWHVPAQMPAAVQRPSMVWEVHIPKAQGSYSTRDWIQLSAQEQKPSHQRGSLLGATVH